MSLELDDNHVAEGKAYLMYQYRGLPKMEALLTPFLEEIQEIENAAWTLISLKDLFLASGAQLDLIGRIVNRAREGRTDDVYRLWLRAQILINRSSGTANEMITLARLVTGADVGEVTLIDWYPARFGVYVGVGMTAEEAATLLELLILAKSAGVAVFLEYASSDESFVFEGGVGLGFGDSTDPSVGGTFAGVTGL